MSNLHLPNLDTMPPKGWRYTVPETGQLFEASSLSELLHNLTAHYKAAGYMLPPNLVRLIEDAICADVPEACGGEPRADRAADAVKQGWLAGLKHTFTNVVNGTRVLAAWLVSGRHYVDDTVANERALVCTSCPENVEPIGCTGCNSGTLREVVRAVVGSRSTPHDARLRACKVCGCDLRAKVHLPHDILWQHMPAPQKALLPAKCWLLTEQPADAPATTTLLSTEVTIINPPPLS